MAGADRRWISTAFVLMLPAIFIVGPRLPCVFADSVNSDSSPLPKHALFRFGSTRFLPRDGIDQIEYSSDGAHLSTLGLGEIGQVEPRVQIWDRQTGREVTPARLRRLEVAGFAWSPKGSQFVTGHPTDSADGGINIWSLGDPAPRRLTQPGVPYASVAWSSSGDRIAARTWTHEVVIFDLNGAELRRFPFSGKWKLVHGLRSIDFSPRGDRLALVTDPGVRVYNVSDGTVAAEIRIEANEIWAIRMLPDSRTIGVAVEDGVKLFNIDKPADKPVCIGKKPTLDFVVSRNQKWLAHASFFSREEAGVWDLSNGSQIHSFESRSEGGIAFSPDDAEICVSTRRLSFLKTGSWQCPSDDDRGSNRLTSGIIHQTQLWTGEIGNTLRGWDLTTGNCFKTIRRTTGTTIGIARIDDQRIAVAGGIPEIEILDTESGKTTAFLSGHSPETYSIAYSAQEKRLVSSGIDGTIRGWKLDSKLSSYEIDLKKKPNGLSNITISPNGKFFVGQEYPNSTIRMFQVSDGKEIWKAVRDRGQIPGFMPFVTNSSQVATFFLTENYQTEIQLRSSSSGGIQSRIDSTLKGVLTGAISPDSKLLAVGGFSRSGNRDDAIEIWSLPNRSRLATFGGHLNHVSWLGFTPDGTRLISLSQDTTGLVWDLPALIKH